MGENSFDEVTTQDRNIVQMNSHVDPISLNKYQLMDECYYGNGHIVTGEFLIPFSRESDYYSRRKLAIYKNYIKPAVRAMVEAVFNEPADRVITDESGSMVEGSMFEKFLGNVDASGMDMQSYSHSVLNICRRHGVVFTVMDNFPSDQQPATKSDAERLRIMPYVYTKKANEVEEFKTDPFGNLKFIIFNDEPEEVNGKDEPRWRRWDTTKCELLKKNKQGNYEVVSSSIHGLGVVPIVILFSDIPENKTDLLVDPPLYNSALINLAIYNQSAEIRDQERAQAFSIFYAQGLPDGDSVFGPKNFINLGTDVTMPPGYASPDFGIIAGLVANQEQLRKDLLATLEQIGVVGVEGEQSGISKAFDFIGQEEVLRRTASLATYLEERIAELFKLYTNESFTYTVIYQSDYAPQGLDKEIDRFDKVFKMPITQIFSNRLQEKLARLVFADDDKEVVKEIIDDIREQEEAKEESMVEPETTEDEMVPGDDEMPEMVEIEDEEDMSDITD